MILTPLQTLYNNVSNLGKIIVAKGFKKLPTVQKITQSGHTGYNGNRLMIRVTRFVQISPLWLVLKSVDNFCSDQFSNWQKYEPTFTIFYTIRHFSLF